MPFAGHREKRGFYSMHDLQSSSSEEEPILCVLIADEFKTSAEVRLITFCEIAESLVAILLKVDTSGPK
jgi:hypothetical protein